MRKIRLLLALLLSAMTINAQDTYFADGMHGGVYGHYPLKTYTDYLISQLKEHPWWRLNLEIEPETWDSVMVVAPQSYAQWKTIMKGKQVEIVNPTYAQPYLYNISGESIIRQFQYGMQKLRQHFPGVEFLTYSSEEPCFTSCLPTIMRLFDMRNLVLKCPDTCWGGYTAPFGNGFVKLLGPDNSAMNTIPRYACEDLEPQSTWQTMAWNNTKEYLKACRKASIANPVGMCYQDAGWKHGPWLLKNKAKSTYILWNDYFRRFAPETAEVRRFSQEDIKPGLMWGTEVLNNIAREVRTSENKMVMAEKIAAMRFMSESIAYPHKAIDNAWRTLLLSQHHDCWIVPYNNNKIGTWAQEVSLWTAFSNHIADSIMNISPLPYSEGDTLRVYNTVGIARKEIVEVPMTKKVYNIGIFDNLGKPVSFAWAENASRPVIHFMAHVPAFGFASYVIKTTKTTPKNIAKGIKISNNTAIITSDCYKLTIDGNRGGIITSLIDRSTGYDYIADGDSIHFNELRGWFRKAHRFMSSTENPTVINVLEDNELVKRVRIDGTINDTPYHNIITLTKGSKRIDFSLTIDWRHDESIGKEYRSVNKNDREKPFYDTRYNLNLCFPTRFSQEVLYKDAPFDICKSQLESTFYTRWDSIKNNVILHWVDVSSTKGKGLTLFTDHTTSYSHAPNYPLALTVAYSGPGLWWRNYPITGVQHMNYSIMPHEQSLQKDYIPMQNDMLNESLTVVSGRSLPFATQSLIELSDPKFSISALTVDQENSLILRIFNGNDNDGMSHFTIYSIPESIDEVNLNDRLLNNISFQNRQKQAEVAISMPRFGLKTYKIKLRNNHNM